MSVETSQAPLEDRNRRLGTAVLRVLTKHSLKLVPVAGPFLELSWDLIEAVHRELLQTGETLPQVTTREIVQSLEHVSPAEARRTVDLEFDTAEGKQLTSGLSPDQKAELKGKLARLPGEFEAILDRIQAEDRERLEDLKIQKAIAERQQRENAEARRQATLSRLHVALKESLEARDFSQAITQAQGILDLEPRDPEIRKIEGYLVRTTKHYSENELGCGLFLLQSIYWFPYIIVLEASREFKRTHNSQFLSLESPTRIWAACSITLTAVILVMAAFRLDLFPYRIRKSPAKWLIFLAVFGIVHATIIYFLRECCSI